MADVPRDPRQLARDILSGKISIEELAREQARRAGGGQVRPARLPERVPLPRPVRPPPRPVIRQQPVRQQPVRQPPPPQRPAAVPAQSAQQRRQQVRPIAEPAASPVVTAVHPVKAFEKTNIAAGEAKVPMVEKQLSIRALMQNRTALRQCMVMAEVLGKPLALRDDL